MNKLNSKQLTNEKWQKVRFDEICKNISDRVENPKNAGTDYYVGLEHLDSEDLVIRRHGTPDDVNATKLRFKKGQILFGKRRFYQRKLAVADKDGICSAHMLVLDALDGKIVSGFLPILMQSEEFFERAMMISEGSLSPTIKWRNLAKQEFWIPSKVQQEKILELIELIDLTITKTYDLIKHYRLFKNSIIDELFTKGINHTEFKSVTSIFKKSVIIPKTWELKTLISLSKSKPQYGSADPALKYDVKLPRYIRITDIDDDGKLKNNEIVSVNITGNEDKILKNNDFLFARSGSVGRSFVFSEKFGYCIFAGYLIRFKLDEKKILPQFLQYYTHSSNYWKWVYSELTQGVQSNINAQQYSQLIIPIPSLNEQKKIVSTLSSIDNTLDSMYFYLSELKLMKKSILSEKLIPKKSEVKIIV
jgi:restriction endonuclease S subunit